MLRYNRTWMTLTMLAALCLTAGLLHAQTAPTVEVRAIAPPGVLLLIDGKMVEVEAMEMAVRGQQVMIWLRELEKLGWGTVMPGDAPGKTVFKSKGVALTFIKGQSIAMVNSLPVQLPIDTYLRDGRLMVPLSFVAKSLGYSFELSMKPVAAVSTQPPPAPAQANSLRGQVLYNGKGVAGIRLALVDPNYNTVRGFQATSDANGMYVFGGVPDGRFMAYVWVGHNPDYFNRVSDEAVLSGGKAIEVPAINLGRILRPVRPKLDEAVTPANGKLTLEWTPCEGAAGYSVVVTEFGKQQKVASTASPKSRVEIPTKQLAPGVKYAIDVEARDADGRLLGGTVGVGGKTWTFTIRPGVSAAPKPVVTVAPKPASKPIVTVKPAH